VEGRSEPDVLFLACTRPAMFLGVPLQAFAVLLVGCGEFFVLSGLGGSGLSRLILTAVVSALAYVACRIATAIDHNIFNILFLWCTTKGRASRNARFWHGSSATPSPLRPARNVKEIVFHA
jgi:type IV secretion system protein VirB3